MRLLLDANLSPRVAAILSDVGHEATHVASIGLLAATFDLQVAEFAKRGHGPGLTAD